jgi:acyl-coenzyme A synthetase/AMP-(fatty) acid ligase
MPPGQTWPAVLELPSATGNCDMVACVQGSDYRISPFELESVLIKHEAVAEAAVIPSPDPLRLAVPKAYVLLAAGRNHTWSEARLVSIAAVP